MRKTVICLAILGLVLGSIALTAGQASATTACYQLSTFLPERLVLDVKLHSVLSSGQKAYSVSGKHVGTCGGGTMVTEDGTVVVNKGPVTPTGAHMGLIGHTVRAGCVPLLWSCTTEEASPTPGVWHCHFRQNLTGTFFTLNLVQIPPDATCAVFQDGPIAPAPEVEGAADSASGLSQ